MNIWKTIYLVSCIVLLLTGVAAVFRVFRPKYIEYRTVQIRKSELEADLRLYEEMLKTYKYKQEQFKNNPRFVERMAHEAGLAKENEVLFRLERTTKNE